MAVFSTASTTFQPKNYRQNTIEMCFVNLKHIEKRLKFTDLLGFLADLSSLVLK